MAVFATNTFQGSPSTGASLFDRIDAVFSAIATARATAMEIEDLAQKSDAALQAEGRTREAAIRYAARAYL